MSAVSYGETAPLEESEGIRRGEERRGEEGREGEGREGRGWDQERRGVKMLVNVRFVSQLFLALTMMCPLSPGIRASPPRIACVKLIFAFECMSNPSR